MIKIEKIRKERKEEKEIESKGEKGSEDEEVGTQYRCGLRARSTLIDGTELLLNFG